MGESAGDQTLEISDGGAGRKVTEPPPFPVYFAEPSTGSAS